MDNLTKYEQELIMIALCHYKHLLSMNAVFCMNNDEFCVGSCQADENCKMRKKDVCDLYNKLFQQYFV